MTYIKQNFISGQKLKAEHMNHIENGIDKLSEDIADLSELDGIVFQMLMKTGVVSPIFFDESTIYINNNKEILLF